MHLPFLDTASQPNFILHFVQSFCPKQDCLSSWRQGCESDSDNLSAWVLLTIPQMIFPISLCYIIWKILTSVYMKKKCKIYNLFWLLSVLSGASAVSGFFASACSLPFDYVKTQIQKMQPDATGKYPYTGSWDCTMKTLKSGGPFKFYTGFPVYCVRIAPHVMVCCFPLHFFRLLITLGCLCWLYFSRCKVHTLSAALFASMAADELAIPENGQKPDCLNSETTQFWPEVRITLVQTKPTIARCLADQNRLHLLTSLLHKLRVDPNDSKLNWTPCHVALCILYVHNLCIKMFLFLPP